MTAATHTSRVMCKTLNGSVRQIDRALGAPRPGAVSVDGRSVAQLLAFAARYGALVRFYDLNDAPHGDWARFFASDPAVAEALHGALDLPEIEGQLHRLLEQARSAQRDEHRAEALRQLMDGIVHLIGILDRGWPEEGEAAQRLQHLASLGRRDELGEHLEFLRVHWTHAGCQAWAVVELDKHGRHWVEGLLSRLEDLLTSLIERMRLGAKAALAASTVSLGERGHAPQAALYNAFVVLFAEAREVLNSFPRRLLDFYYGEVIGQHQLHARPDQVYLTFTLGKNAAATAIPRGTLFSAGTDPYGDPIQYAADTSLEVTPVAVTSLGVHRLTYLESVPSVATGVLSGVIAQDQVESVPSAPFPLFGRDQAGMYGALSLQPASLGFMVATPMLMLRGGSRTVKLHLTHADPHPHSDEHAASLGEVAGSALSLYYSTAGGWVAVQSFTVTPGLSDKAGNASALTFAFTLPPDAPAVVPLSTKADPDGPHPDLPASAFPGDLDCPCLVATLAQKPGGAPDAASGSALHFAILSLIQVAQITLEVAVEGLIPTALSSAGSPLDPKHNFAIFGLQPAQYATLSMSAPEIFVKQIASLQVSIAWAGLPINSTGFQGYYQGYRLDADGLVSPQPLFDNASFQTRFDVTSPGSWTLNASSSCHLFETDDMSGLAHKDGAPVAGAPVSMISRLVVSGITPSATPAYYNPQASALRLTLAAPSYAFGAMLYASNLMAASSASVAALRAGGAGSGTGSNGGAGKQIASAANVNATAPDKRHASDLGAAVKQAISALNGEALALLQQIAPAGTSASASTHVASGIEQLLGGVVNRATGGVWGVVAGLARAAIRMFKKKPEAGEVTHRLRSWLLGHQHELDAGAKDSVQRVHALLTASDGLGAALGSVSGQAPAVARPIMAAALQQARVSVDQADASSAEAATVCLPNPPWLPMVSSLTLAYTATAVVTMQALEPGEQATPAASEFMHLCPFDRMALAERTPPGHRVQLLPRVARHAALYIDLSAHARQVALLFILQASPDGWTSEQPVVIWEQRVDNRWRRVKVIGDSTNGMLNSGIVTLVLHAPSRTAPAQTPQLRVRLIQGMAHSPMVSAVVANALTATWVPPGGAQQRGQPLPAGTITQMPEPIAGIATIKQPMNSIGGCPPAVGPRFDMWMAERLRHKGFAIDAWDYARIVLDAVPTLWQLGVVPATDASTGHEMPGHVWVVAVAGPDTPNVDDRTAPLVDPTVLAQIGELLERVSSPFVTLTVSNPPWVRITVHADLIFSDADTVDAWEARLQDELVRWLSPWPDASLGARPADYFSRQAVAAFIHRRDYVLGVTSMHLHTDGDQTREGWHYLTSAAHHQLRGTSARAAAAVPARTAQASERAV